MDHEHHGDRPHEEDREAEQQTHGGLHHTLHTLHVGGHAGNQGADPQFIHVMEREVHRLAEKRRAHISPHPVRDRPRGVDGQDTAHHAQQGHHDHPNAHRDDQGGISAKHTLVDDDRHDIGLQQLRHDLGGHKQR